MCKVELLGNIEEENKHQSGNIYGVGGVAPNLMAGTHGWGMGYYLEIKRIKIDELERVQSSRGVGEKKSNNGTQYFQQDRIYSMGDICLCLPANIPYGSYKFLEIKKISEKEIGKWMKP